MVIKGKGILIKQRNMKVDSQSNYLDYCVAIGREVATMRQHGVGLQGYVLMGREVARVRKYGVGLRSNHQYHHGAVKSPSPATCCILRSKSAMINYIIHAATIIININLCALAVPLMPPSAKGPGLNKESQFMQKSIDDSRISLFISILSHPANGI